MKRAPDRKSGRWRESARPPRRAAVVASLCALALLWPADAAAAELYKCTDGKQVTYSSASCEKLGLRSAGQIKDKLTVVPAERRAAQTAQPKKKDDIADEERARKDAVKLKPVNPLIEKPLK